MLTEREITVAGSQLRTLAHVYFHATSASPSLTTHPTYPPSPRTPHPQPPSTIPHGRNSSTPRSYSIPPLSARRPHPCYSSPLAMTSTHFSFAPQTPKRLSSALLVVPFPHLYSPLLLEPTPLAYFLPLLRTPLIPAHTRSWHLRLTFNPHATHTSSSTLLLTPTPHTYSSLLLT